MVSTWHIDMLISIPHSSSSSSSFLFSRFSWIAFRDASANLSPILFLGAVGPATNDDGPP
jgi:hypothetical protein